MPYDRLAINLMVPSLSPRPLHPSYVVADDGHLTRVAPTVLSGGPVPPAVATAASWESTGAGACYSPAPGAGVLTIQPAPPPTGDRLLVRIRGRFGAEAALTVAVDGRNVPVTATDGRGLAYLGATTVGQLLVFLPADQGCIAAVSIEQLDADPG